VINTGTIEGRDGQAISFGAGDDSYMGTRGTQSGTLLGIIDMGAGNDSFIGGAGVETVVGGEGNDTIRGGGGVDYLKFETDKNITVDLGIVSRQNTGEGLDQIENIENLIGGSGHDTFFGSAAANTLMGGSGNDILNGMGGVDRLEGGQGHDTFLIDEAGDVLVEAEGEGDDIARTSVSYALGEGVHFEELQALGNTSINLTGNELSNTLRGNVGINTLSGETGNDALNGGVEADDLRGGEGIDFAVYWDAAATDVAMGTGLVASLNDKSKNTGEAKGDSYDGIEGLHGSDFHDTLKGSNSGNDLLGRGGNDHLYGLGGQDYLSGGGGHDVLYGGAGADGFDGGDGYDIVDYTGAATGVVVDLEDRGNNKGDALGDIYDDNIEGIGGTAHRDELYGKDGRQDLYGNGGDDVLEGRDGDDLLGGNQGNDLLVGGTGNDTLDSGGGTDTAVFTRRMAEYTINRDPDLDGYITVSHANGTGAEGIDKLKDVRILKFSDGAIVLTNAAPMGLQLVGSSIQENAPGGAEVGTLSARDADGDTLTYSLLPGSSSAFAIRGNKLVVTGPLDFETQPNHQVTILADDGFEGTTSLTVNLTVTNKTDETTPFTLWGTPEADVLTGEAGDDTIYGSEANDVLSGMAGNDKIHGGAGNDLLSGGAGKDVFVFDTRANKRTNVDRVEDFRYQDDSIFMENRIFTKLGTGSFSKPKKFKADMFTSGTKAKDAEDRIVYDKKTGNLYYDQDGTGSKAQVKIATLTNKATLKYSDFFVI
jgi:Ca2+-binding RTX toxin-like protein